MLFETGAGFLIEAETEKGRSLVPTGEWRRSKAEPEPPRLDPQAAFPDPRSIPWAEYFDDAYWQKMSERCLSCRACAYVCPTCRCFAVRDERLGSAAFERIRCWDSCAGENYRRLAGGHQPRPEKGERLRNRFYCKFSFFPAQVGLDGTSACTGCGRCIDVCPAGVDISEVLQDLGRPA
jgi:ferredoxin